MWIICVITGEMGLYKNILVLIVLFAVLSACNDDDTFSVSPVHTLTFSADTIRLGTVFSNVSTAAKSFWIYNFSGSGIRCSTVRLERGNQSGFRVNVDGVYLGKATGYQANDIEIRDKDSVRVFVELTSAYNYKDTPQKIEDNLILTLESRKVQKVNLNAYSWDAIMLRSLRVKRDTTIIGSKPIIVYGGIIVDSTATLRIGAGTTLFFHYDAGIDVYGRFIAEGSSTENVVLRGDRLDHMFNYLPYDNVSGQWQGIRLHTSSYNNIMNYTDIHNTFDGVVADSSDAVRTKLTLNASTIHNCQGYGLMSINSKMVLNNSQLTNALKDCIFFDGGLAILNGCTVGQFYPFDSKRGVAFRFSSVRPQSVLSCSNTLITGYAKDELSILRKNRESVADFHFDHCIIRTPKWTTTDSARFVRVEYENVKDTMKYGKKHFVKIDTEKLCYDFQLADVSPAINKASSSTSLPTDRNGMTRDAKPDIGAFEYIKRLNENEDY